MSKENLQQFCLLVLRDSALQDQLKNIIERDEFIKKVCELGANSGFEILREDIEIQMRENRKMLNERWI